jgi:glyceraldehyde-3-phosphate dehydrogenase/erythrose-4-phosphate dehydrogenase
MAGSMKVMVNGVGTIGTTLLQVLAAHRGALGIDEVYARKNTVRPWDVAGLELLKGLDVTVVADEYPGQATFAEVRDEIGYVFDTTAAGGARRNRPTYDEMSALVGASGQGTETGFGMPYALGMGIDTREDRYVHVVSCSTHAALCVLRTLSAGRLDDIVSADFVNVRRSEDVGHHERLVGGNVLARHLDPDLGTHHAIDASRVLAVLGQRVEMQSSDITTPSQFLHSTRFSVRLPGPVTPEEVAMRIEREPWAATTAMFDSNKVFEAGRRFGFAGRLFSQVVFVPGNVLVKGDMVSGWAFVPQEGNTVLSTVSAFLQRTHPAPDDALAEVASHLLLRAL